MSNAVTLFDGHIEVDQVVLGTVKSAVKATNQLGSVAVLAFWYAVEFASHG